MKYFLDSIRNLLLSAVVISIIFGICGMLIMLVIKFLIWFYGVLF